jgi:hypothetical protein
LHSYQDAAQALKILARKKKDCIKNTANLNKNMADTFTVFSLNSSGDLDITGGRQQLSSDTQAIATMLSTRLRMIQGEWFLNLLAGIDYFGSIFGKKKIDVEVSSELKIGILSVQGVVELTDFNLELTEREVNKNNLECSFQVKTVFNQDVEQTLDVGI